MQLPDQSPSMQQQYGQDSTKKQRQKQNNNQQHQGQFPKYDLEKICKDNEIPVNKNLLKFDFFAKFSFAAVVLPYLVGWFNFTYEAWEIVLVTVAFFFMIAVNVIIALITNMEFK